METCRGPTGTRSREVDEGTGLAMGFGGMVDEGPRKGRPRLGDSCLSVFVVFDLVEPRSPAHLKVDPQIAILLARLHDIFLIHYLLTIDIYAYANLVPSDGYKYSIPHHSYPSVIASAR